MGVGVDAMKLVELFCGTGGFSRGAHAAGFEVAAAYDIDPTLTSSFPTNFPNTKLFLRDVGKLTGPQIKADIGQDAFGLFGGPPCQGFSDIGLRKATDPRRQLLGHFFRIAAELQPAFFIMENVRGLAYTDALPVLEAALEIVAPDYAIAGPKILNAADFGAATNRHRMFVVGIRKDLERSFDWEALESFKKPAATVADALADLEGAVALKPGADLGEFDRWRIVRRGAPRAYVKPLRSADREFTGNQITTHTAPVVARFARVRPGEMDKVGRHPRLDPLGQCPTLRAGTGVDRGSFQSVRPIHPTQNRVITVREAARLQGFPDWHLFHPTIWHSFRMIGNSVSPIMSEAIFLAVRSCLGSAAGNNVESDQAEFEHAGGEMQLAAE
jgi:DNA (cytosine-5)-methyltransferase 1